MIVVGLLRMIPLMGGALIGLVAHRFAARRVIGASVTAGLAVHGVLIAVAATGRLAVWHLAIAAFVSGVALAVDFTVRRPLLGSIMPTDLLGRAMSLDFTANTVARMLGPALTGALLDGFGRPAIFVLGAVVYLAALLSIAPVRLGDVDVSASEVDLSAMVEGYRFARATPDIMAVVATTITMNLFVFPYRHFVPVIGTEVLGLDATRVGLLTAVEGVGMTAASLGLTVWVRPHQFLGILNAGTALAAAGAVVFGLSASVPLSIVAVFTVGIGIALFASIQPAIVVRDAPPGLRSRVMGLIGTLIGTNPLGLLLLGALATLLGTAPGVVAAGSVGLGTVVASAVRRRYVGRRR